MNRTKYDGKLTDALIQTVIDAENRLQGLETRPGDATGDSVSESHGEPISQPDAKAIDYAAEFDRSRHAVSIEESRERSVGCYERSESE